MLRRVLLICGALSSALYLVAVDVVAALAHPEYHGYASQMVSELMARDAPTRPVRGSTLPIPYSQGG